jgi:hypothetical protein
MFTKIAKNAQRGNQLVKRIKPVCAVNPSLSFIQQNSFGIMMASRHMIFMCQMPFGVA